jgi:hypothetical protein
LAEIAKSGFREQWGISIWELRTTIAGESRAAAFDSSAILGVGVT